MPNWYWKSSMTSQNVTNYAPEPESHMQLSNDITLIIVRLKWDFTHVHKLFLGVVGILELALKKDIVV